MYAFVSLCIYKANFTQYHFTVSSNISKMKIIKQNIAICLFVACFTSYSTDAGFIFNRASTKASGGVSVGGVTGGFSVEGDGGRYSTVVVDSLCERFLIFCGNDSKPENNSVTIKVSFGFAITASIQSFFGEFNSFSNTLLQFLVNVYVAGTDVDEGSLKIIGDAFEALIVLFEGVTFETEDELQTALDEAETQFQIILGASAQFELSLSAEQQQEYTSVTTSVSQLIVLAKAIQSSGEAIVINIKFTLSESQQESVNATEKNLVSLQIAIQFLLNSSISEKDTVTQIQTDFQAILQLLIQVEFDTVEAYEAALTQTVTLINSIETNVETLLEDSDVTGQVRNTVLSIQGYLYIFIDLYAVFNVDGIEVPPPTSVTPTSITSTTTSVTTISINIKFTLTVTQAVSVNATQNLLIQLRIAIQLLLKSTISDKVTLARIQTNFQAFLQLLIQVEFDTQEEYTAALSKSVTLINSIWSDVSVLLKLSDLSSQDKSTLLSIQGYLYAFIDVYATFNVGGITVPSPTTATPTTVTPTKVTVTPTNTVTSTKVTVTPTNTVTSTKITPTVTPVTPGPAIIIGFQASISLTIQIQSLNAITVQLTNALKALLNNSQITDKVQITAIYSLYVRILAKLNIRYTSQKDLTQGLTIAWTGFLEVVAQLKIFVNSSGIGAVVKVAINSIIAFFTQLSQIFGQIGVVLNGGGIIVSFDVSSEENSSITQINSGLNQLYNWTQNSAVTNDLKFLEVISLIAKFRASLTAVFTSRSDLVKVLTDDVIIINDLIVVILDLRSSGNLTAQQEANLQIVIQILFSFSANFQVFNVGGILTKIRVAFQLTEAQSNAINQTDALGVKIWSTLRILLKNQNIKDRETLLEIEANVTLIIQLLTQITFQTEEDFSAALTKAVVIINAIGVEIDVLIKSGDFTGNDLNVVISLNAYFYALIDIFAVFNVGGITITTSSTPTKTTPLITTPTTTPTTTTPTKTPTTTTPTKTPTTTTPTKTPTTTTPTITPTTTTPTITPTTTTPTKTPTTTTPTITPTTTTPTITPTTTTPTKTPTTTTPTITPTTTTPTITTPAIITTPKPHGGIVINFNISIVFKVIIESINILTVQIDNVFQSLLNSTEIIEKTTFQAIYSLYVQIILKLNVIYNSEVELINGITIVLSAIQQVVAQLTDFVVSSVIGLAKITIQTIIVSFSQLLQFFIQLGGKKDVGIIVLFNVTTEENNAITEINSNLGLLFNWTETVKNDNTFTEIISLVLKFRLTLTKVFTSKTDLVKVLTDDVVIINTIFFDIAKLNSSGSLTDQQKQYLTTVYTLLITFKATFQVFGVTGIITNPSYVVTIVIGFTASADVKQSVDLSNTILASLENCLEDLKSTTVYSNSDVVEIVQEYALIYKVLGNTFTSLQSLKTAVTNATATLEIAIKNLDKLIKSGTITDNNALTILTNIYKCSLNLKDTFDDIVYGDGSGSITIDFFNPIISIVLAAIDNIINSILIALKSILATIDVSLQAEFRVIYRFFLGIVIQIRSTVFKTEKALEAALFIVWSSFNDFIIKIEAFLVKVADAIKVVLTNIINFLRDLVSLIVKILFPASSGKVITIGFNTTEEKNTTLSFISSGSANISLTIELLLKLNLNILVREQITNLQSIFTKINITLTTKTFETEVDLVQALKFSVKDINDAISIVINLLTSGNLSVEARSYLKSILLTLRFFARLFAVFDVTGIVSEEIKLSFDATAVVTASVKSINGLISYGFELVNILLSRTDITDKTRIRAIQTAFFNVVFELTSVVYVSLDVLIKNLGDSVSGINSVIQLTDSLLVSGGFTATVQFYLYSLLNVFTSFSISYGQLNVTGINTNTNYCPCTKP